MKTSDNRCPMLCLLKSNNLPIQQKKEIYFKIVNNFQIPINDDVIKEVNKRNFYDNEPQKIDGELKNELTLDEKEQFYNSVIYGNLEEFKSYIYGTGTSGKSYNIFEEVSEPGYKLTVFHCAMSYGKWDIIKFIIEYLTKLNLLDKALKMKTKDNRCPILCLLKSNKLYSEQKKELYFKLINTFHIPISDEVINEAKDRHFYDNNQQNNDLEKDEKKKVLNSLINDNLEEFKSYILGTGPSGESFYIFEEVSEPGKKWTVFHYAMAYGKWAFIKFIIEYLTDLHLLDTALNMKTQDNRCPLLCLLKSTKINPEQKRKILTKLSEELHIPINNEVKEELNAKNMQDLLK